MDEDKYIEQAYYFFKQSWKKFHADKDLKNEFHYDWVIGVADMSFRMWLSDRIQKHREQQYQNHQKTDDDICIKCGRRLTQGEQDWIQRHNSENICYHCRKQGGQQQ